MNRLCIVFALLMTVGCGSKDAAPDAGPDANTTGTASLSWQVNAESAGCDGVGAVTVGVSLTPAGGGIASVDSFSCAAGSASVANLAPGTYNTEIRLSAPFSTTLDSDTVASVTIVAGEDTNLGAFDFTVAKEGDLSFTITTGDADGNCDAGTNLSGTILEYRTTAGACIAGVSMAVGAGGTSGKAAIPTFSSTCPGTEQVCIESDQEITFSDVESGPHKLYVGGKTAPIEDPPCYTVQPQLSVIGGGELTEAGQQTLVDCFEIDAGI